LPAKTQKVGYINFFKTCFATLEKLNIFLRRWRTFAFRHSTRYFENQEIEATASISQST